MAALTGKIVGTPDNSYLSLLHLSSNDIIGVTGQKIQDGGGNDTGLTISTTLLEYANTLKLSGLTASTLLALNASKEVVSIANSAGFAYNDGAGNISWGAIAAPLTDTYVGYGNGSNVLTGSAGFQYDYGASTLWLYGGTTQSRVGYQLPNIYR